MCLVCNTKSAEAAPLNLVNFQHLHFYPIMSICMMQEPILELLKNVKGAKEDLNDIDVVK